MKRVFGQLIRAIPLVALLTILCPRFTEAQILSNAVCPRDSTGGQVDDGGGAYRTGTQARRYVVSFLSGNPGSVARTSTGTSSVDTTSIRILTDFSDAAACRRLNSIMNNGASTERTSPPWVYFRAGGFYFVARWTPPQPMSNYTIKHESVVVFDSSFNLVGVWTA
jgi:hypothetical protein